MRRALRPLALHAAVALASLVSTSTARAADDCPPGSTSVTEDGFSWCQPSVCANDGQCKPNEVCRPIALCLQVGTLADASTMDGGKRLVVTQRCVAGQEPGDPKTCPQNQTCSDMSRCVSKAAAEKLGLIDVPGSSASTSGAGGAAPPAKKSSCGCDVVGASTAPGAGLALGAAVTLLAARRRRRP